jgi:6-phosphogluconate dehydrogenase
MEEVARIWRGGCIIRAAVLDKLRAAYRKLPLPVSPLTDDQLSTDILARQGHLRTVVAKAAQFGIPAPAFGSSLSYYDGLRAERLPAAVIQGQRDFFGAHTYKRIDKPGTFHTQWSGDRTEISAEDTH